MTRHALSERHLLCDELLRLGPDAPTKCEGWDTRDLAAHLVIREERPDLCRGSGCRSCTDVWSASSHA